MSVMMSSAVSSSLSKPTKGRSLPEPGRGHDRIFYARAVKNGGHNQHHHHHHQQQQQQRRSETKGGLDHDARGSRSSEDGPRPPTNLSSAKTAASLPPVHKRPPSITPRPLKGWGSKAITASPFSPMSLREHRHIRLGCPPVAGAFRARPAPPSEFRFFYERGDFPIAVEHDSQNNKISWKVEIDKLDYHHYLPLFFDGLSETKFPYNFFARQGILDMLTQGGHKVVPVIPQLVLPIKKALQTRNPEVVCVTLKILQALVHADEMVGEALVPYYRQLLPVLQLFKNCNRNIGDGIEYGQRRRENLGDLVNATLELLEKHGGPDAFINIKYMVPTYESCVLN